MSSARESILQAIEQIKDEVSSLSGQRAVLDKRIEKLLSTQRDLERVVTELNGDMPHSKKNNEAPPVLNTEKSTPASKQESSSKKVSTFQLTGFGTQFFLAVFGGNPPNLPESLEEAFERMHPDGWENIPVNVFSSNGRGRIDVPLQQEIEQGDRSQMLNGLRKMAHNLWTYHTLGYLDGYTPPKPTAVRVLGCMSRFSNEEIETALKRMELIH